ncbi:low molecular weight protein tyrosine phosphatase family protein [Solitalea canadensis]|uniref:Phosphotyrosine protein phosphatase I domain-containing protein n=1 Tax=Solitalea canadensis (strain ATCC 29591 / DSM 3403 / JCM 21819 / LMG 8368 / NBRC 15130 / NCIMB 12057 / USAM 9D) TaxID=929556 RepID=H8KPN3_SOLCM|nr:protein-tyrosine-phosphatase [Solitalea canadensis]AFD05931.1 putative protein tyrosine phosphatase [Solitalea canadensis DSM 3403]
MNILFVCSKNKWRSRTAETIFQQLPDHVVKSAGTSDDARIKLTAKHIDWADLIFVMEIKHRQIINKKFPNAASKKLVILDIPDDYQYMDKELIFTLQTAVEPFL